MNDIIFPGQDYNNARVYDFEDVNNWENNKLDRTKSSRMGWSDISISLQGHIVDNLVDHFIDRWAFIWNEKYKEKDPGKYALLSPNAPQQEQPRDRGYEDNRDRGYGENRGRGYGDQAPYPDFGDFETPFHLRQHARRFLGDTDDEDHHDDHRRSHERPRRSMKVQVVRRYVQSLFSLSLCPVDADNHSSSQWSGGTDTENSIAKAYIEIINNAKHFIYIENQVCQDGFPFFGSLWLLTYFSSSSPLRPPPTNRLRT